jgi:hypothetical protein
MVWLGGARPPTKVLVKLFLIENVFVIWEYKNTPKNSAKSLSAQVSLPNFRQKLCTMNSIGLHHPQGGITNPQSQV